MSGSLPTSHFFNFVAFRNCLGHVLRQNVLTISHNHLTYPSLMTIMIWHCVDLVRTDVSKKHVTSMNFIFVGCILLRNVHVKIFLICTCNRN
jgi:hypothetical protein